MAPAKKNKVKTPPENEINNAPITGNKDRDELRIYLESEFYDCTFKVSSEKGGTQIFRCHKFVLGRASQVLKIMLMGKFKEGLSGPDDEIMMDNVSPAAFDLVMRFLYGNEDDFKSTDLAVEVFMFAHKWQIDHLLKVVSASVYLSKIGTEQILPIYEMHMRLGMDDQIAKTLQLLQKDTRQVLTTKAWLAADPAIILNIFEQSYLNASEMELLDALIEWSKANESEENKEIFNKCIRKIRFRSFSSEEFGSFCLEKDIGLTDKEKLNILLSIDLHKENLMPPDFAPESYPRTLKNKTRCSWMDRFSERKTITAGSCSEFTFSIANQGFYLDGVYLHSFCYGDKTQGMELECVLVELGSKRALASASFEVNNTKNKNGVVQFSQPFALRKDTKYSIKVSYNADVESAYYYLVDRSLKFSDLTVEIPLGVNEVLDIIGLSFSS